VGAVGVDLDAEGGLFGAVAVAVAVAAAQAQALHKAEQ